MKYFITEYKSNKNTFSSGFYASNENEAEQFCIQRGINEIITGTTDSFEGFTNEIFKNLESKELLHLVTFCSWIYIKLFPNSLDFVMSDTGVLHELIHFQSNIELLTDKTELEKRIKHIVKNVYRFPNDHSILK